MKRFYKNNYWLLIALPVLLITVLWEIMSWRSFNTEFEAKKIYNVLEFKEKELDEKMSLIVKKVRGVINPENIWYLINPAKYDDNEIAFSILRNNSLVFWTSSQIAFSTDDNSERNAIRLVHLPTGWFLMHSRHEGGYTVKGYILIKKEFPSKNKYLHNSFQEDFNLPPDYIVSSDHRKGAINVTRDNGEFLFSVIPVKGAVTENNTNFIVFLYFLLLLLLLAQVNLWLVRKHFLNPASKFMAAVLVAVLVYIIMNRMKIPVTVYNSELFSPIDFAYGEWLSSLGEYLILSVLMFYVAQSFLTLFRLEYDPEKKNSYLKIFVAFLFAALYFSFSVFLFRILLLNSNISLEFFRDLQFSFVNLISFFCISLHTLGFIVIILRLRAEFYSEIDKNRAFLYLLFALVLIYPIFIIDGNISLLPLIFYLITSGLLFIVLPERVRRYKFTFLLIISILSASYLNLFSHKLDSEKKNNVQKLLAVNLSSERDPAAEVFLAELDEKFMTDTMVSNILIPPYKSIESYFRTHYFTGFWRNYDLKITVCSPIDSLEFVDVGLRYPCFEFFRHLQASSGVMIPGSKFYFMDRLNGRISYLGQLERNFLHIYIELYSKIIPEGSGYPELLLDEKTIRPSRMRGFSYSKYYEGKLVDRGGEYQYEMHLPKEVQKNTEFRNFVKNGYEHCSFHNGGNNYIIVSYNKSDFDDQVKTFPYLFLLVYISGLIILVINRPGLRLKKKTLDFRGKIRLTLILSLLGISTLVGFGLIIYNYNQFKINLQKDLNEKLFSISSELGMRIGNEVQLSHQVHDMLSDQLISLSDVTLTDINLYTPEGELFATSRSEIFERGFNSRKMNPEAYHALSIGSRTSFLHNENLGEMSFLSAYIPVYNKMNELLGYLNLPYFTRQDEFKKDVSAFIITFSNVYILLILISLVLALVIGNKLTLPLLKIEKNLKGIQLGKVNAKIEYLGEDEIGRLAKEYNKKVDELAESAALLARSERELAWREMARQVAHEINNPLTPMKLNIQYLRKIKEQGSGNFDEYFEQVSRTLIENIDVLSSIASSFSDFARMPGVQNQLVDLSERIKEAVSLFENTTNVLIDIDFEDNHHLKVMADKDQFSRVLINLIKNGIQSIHHDKGGRLVIGLKREESFALISISDNGTGIPPEMQEKLFEPSFTTKSSGMGLGLAITKRIIESIKGTIWFETEPDKGTTFYIKIPLAEIL